MNERATKSRRLVLIPILQNDISLSEALTRDFTFPTLKNFLCLLKFLLDKMFMKVLVSSVV